MRVDTDVLIWHLRGYAQATRGVRGVLQSGQPSVEA